MTGRPTDCTPERIAKFEEALRDGFSVTAAGQVIGVSKTSVMEWLRRGRDGEQPFAEFAHRTQMAKQEAQRGLEAVVLTAARKDPKIAMAILRTRHPEDWAPAQVQRVELTGANGGPVSVEAIRAAVDLEVKGKVAGMADEDLGIPAGLKGG